MVDARIADRLNKARRAGEQKGRLLPEQRLEASLANFRARFGPDRLRSLSGPALLELMHRHGNHDSLVYWLEFKDDEEFAQNAFGSIAGGSALKFRLYQRVETGAWTTGTSNDQRVISVDEAVRMAESHRDQLLAGVEALAALRTGATIEDYRRLQETMARAAPDLCDLGWAHKYLFLLYPDRLDDYHSFVFQRFMCVKLLTEPPESGHRYEAAHTFVTWTRELGWPMYHFTGVLNEYFGEPHRYWRVGTRAGNDNESQWDRMRDRGCIAVGYDPIGDLSSITASAEGKDQLRKLMEPHQPNASTLSNQLTQLFNFAVNAAVGDLVLAADGDRILAIGRISGEYAFEPQFRFKHVRPVTWLSFESWTLPDPSEVRLSTFRPVNRIPNLLAIEQLLAGADDRAAPQPPPPPAPEQRLTPSGPFPVPMLAGVAGRVQAALERKGQVIVYGPPGTGKTYVAEQAVKDLAALQNFNTSFERLTAEQKGEVLGHARWRGYVRILSFHPGYGYEDFIEGYRPSADGAHLRFALRDGVFKQLCADAAERPDRRFYLLIDEINRGDVPRILGELMTVLELDKRDKEVVLPLSGTRFRVPMNVRIVGTMNTADRSIALLDAALRRRFVFIELMPDYDVLDSPEAEIDLGALLKNLNARLREHVKRDARNLQVGHAYLLEGGKPIADLRRLARVLHDDVVPLVQEYCYDDFDALREILGSGFVDADAEAIRTGVFDRMEELRDALARLGPDVVRQESRLEATSEPGDPDAEP